MSKITADGKIDGFVDHVDNRLLHGQPGVYGITHVPTKTVYVGSTSNISRRTAEHKSDLKRGGHPNRNLQERYNQDPTVSFGFQITRTAEEARVIEQSILDANTGSSQLLNIATDACASGRGRPAQVWSEERRKIYGQHVQERWQDPEYRSKIEARRRTDENRNRTSAWSKEFWENNRDEMTAAHRTEEAARNHSTAMSGRWDDPQSRALLMEGVERTAAKKRKAIVINGATYEGINKAAEATGMAVSTIFNRLRSTAEKFSGYQYAD